MRRCIGVLALFATIAAAGGCGDDNGSSQNSNGTGYDAALYDATGDAAADAGDDGSLGDAAGDVNPDATIGPTYEPALADLGDPPATCPTEIIHNRDRPSPAQARVFVPNYRIDFDVLSSQRSFREDIHDLVHRQVLPCLAADKPNVIVFPEAMGLPMLLIGQKAASARQLDQSTQALTSMITEVEPAFSYYTEKFPDASLTGQFLLAMTDTVVRATYDTFGQIADRYDIYVSVTVDLPDFEKVTDPALVERLGDPDYATHQYAFEATSADVYNRQILFGPDGSVVDQTLKTYVTQAEIDQLDLAPADFTDIHPMQTPWGRTGVVISKPAWMPDVQDRLEDMGAQVIFQPEAYLGGWVRPLPPSMSAEAARWEPDVFSLGGYNLVQRSARATHSFVAQLTGNFFEMPADGQVQVVEKASRQTGRAAFVGQKGPLAGNVFVGPWVAPDPGVADPTLSLAERRGQLREVGAKLIPGSGDPLEGDYVEGMWAADLVGPPSSEPVAVDTHPQLAHAGDTTYVVSSHGNVGTRHLQVQRVDAGALGPKQTLPISGFDVVRPAVAVGPQLVHIVAELIGDGENRLVYTAFDPAAGIFVGSPKIIDPHLVGQWAFHPSIQVSDQVLHISWIERVGDANRAHYAQTSLSDPFANLSVDTAIEARPSSREGVRANQWDARLAVAPEAIAVTWLDFRDWQWAVMASVSLDGGLNWSRPVRLDAVSEGVEALNSTPTIEAIGDRQFRIAWTDARATRANTRIATATLTARADGGVEHTDAVIVDAAAPFDVWSWRPTITHNAQGDGLFWETMQAGEWRIDRATIDADGTIGEPDAVVSASATAKHYAAVDPASGVLVFESVAPFTGGASHLQVESLSIR